MNFSFSDFFLHPLLRGPTWGTLFLCISFSLMGVFLLLQKRSLLSETLSHATWPGILVALWIESKLFHFFDSQFLVAILIGGTISSWCAVFLINWMERKGKVATDASLCFILASFFGVGTILTSFLQFSIPKAYQKAQTLLFGQAAVLDDHHLYLYGILVISIISFIYFNFHRIKIFLFDREFAKNSGIRIDWVERIVLFFILFSLLLGIQSIGVLLISGMSIAPAVAARQLTNRLGSLFLIAGLVGAFSAFLGNFFSVWASYFFSYPGYKISFATGPVIILVATFFALLSLLFSPSRGLLFRKIRVLGFRLRCLEENLVKAFWKEEKISYQKIVSSHQIPTIWLKIVLWRLKRSGWLGKENHHFFLTKDGKRKAATIVRLHRLWELYLTNRLGVEREKVHMSAEEMEHVLTPDFEKRLTFLLKNPKKDPHNQKIPEKGAFYE